MILNIKLEIGKNYKAALKKNFNIYHYNLSFIIFKVASYSGGFIEESRKLKAFSSRLQKS